MKSNLKIVPAPLTPAREELRDSIAEVEQAEVAASNAKESVELAHAKLREKKRTHVSAVSALEEATSPPKTLDQKLKEAWSVDEQLEIVDAHNASLRREPLTAEDLKRLRQGVDAAADALIIASRALEVAEARAIPTVSALNRAKDRRQQAVFEVTRPQVGKLMLEAQAIIELLIAKRAALNFASSLLDPYRDERRQAFNFLNRMSFPEEGGLRTDTDLSKRDRSVAQWQAFAQRIETDASAEFSTE